MLDMVCVRGRHWHAESKYSWSNVVQIPVSELRAGLHVVDLRRFCSIFTHRQKGAIRRGSPGKNVGGWRCLERCDPGENVLPPHP